MSPQSDPRRGGIAVLAVILALGALTLGGGGMIHFHGDTSRRAPTELGDARPDIPVPAVDAYTRLVRSEFIDKQRLVVRQDVDDNAGVPIVDLVPSIYQGKDPEAWIFASRSSLLNDIMRNDPSIWTIENGRVIDIDGSAHLTPGPFDNRTTWRGRVLYRRPPENAIDTSEVALASNASGEPQLHLFGEADRLQSDDPRLQTLILDKPSVLELRGAAVMIYCRASDVEAVALLKRVGDQAIMLGQSPRNDCNVRVSGKALKAKEFAAIGIGDHVIFQAGPNRAIDYERIQPGAPATELSLPTATGDRLRAPSAAWWVQAVEKDFTAALSKTGDRSRDIHTSLDPVMQPGVQALLDQYVSSANISQTNKPPRIGVITVMNALTGEVLAMASTPHASQTRRDLVDQDDPSAKVARVNQNLQLLPIGSAAKPLFSAAILSVHPDLVTLTIPAHEETKNLLGMTISKLQTHAVGSAVNFDSFIQWSDNIYAASLLLMGSSDRGSRTCALQPGEWYAIGGKTFRDRRPKSIFETTGSDGTCHTVVPVGVNQLDWANRFRDLFDANVMARAEQGQVYVANCSAGGGRYGDDIHDATPWRELFAIAADLPPCRFINSTPTREALALDAARDFRSDLLPTMLGNGEGRWSAVKVAEAYSRVVTGRQVDAAFTPVPNKEAKPLANYPIDIRRSITHAMTLVPKGTASNTELPGALTAVADQLAPARLVLGAFAKTGTPVLVESDYTNLDKAINLLIQRGLVRYDDGEVRVGNDSGSELLNADTSTAEINRIAIELGAQASFREVSGRFGVTVHSVIRTLAAYVRELKQGRTPFVVERGALLVRVGARRDDNGDESDKRLPHGKVLALVIATYDPSRSTDLALARDGRADNAVGQPSCAFTVVVNLQFQVENRSNAAADLAGQVVKEFLAKRLACGGRSDPDV